MSIFEKATRQKVRFPFKGWASVEDLWDLSLKDLDSIYKNLYNEAQKASEVSLLDDTSAEDTYLALQIDIVKYIVNVKKEEAQKRKDAAARKAEKQKLLEIIAEKENEQLKNADISELRKRLEEL